MALEWKATLDTASAVASGLALSKTMGGAKAAIIDASAALKNFGGAAPKIPPIAPPKVSTAPPVNAPAPGAEKPLPDPPTKPTGEKPGKSTAPKASAASSAADEKRAASEAKKGEADKKKQASAFSAFQKRLDKEAIADEKKADSDAKKRKAALIRELNAGVGQARVVALGAAGAVTAIGTGVLALGARAAGGLAPLVLGYQGAARLQGILARTGIAARGLFSQVNPGPALGAIEKFSKNFDKTTVTGAALTGIIGRLSAVFEPIIASADVFASYLVNGLLRAENAILSVRIALVPYEGLLGGIVSKSTLFKGATAAIGVSLVALGVSAAAAALPFVALGAAITAVTAAFDRYQQLAKAWDGDQFWNKIKTDVGMTVSDADRGIVTGADYDALQNRAKVAASRASKSAADVPAAKASGEAIGDGIVAGMESKTSAVAAAGASLAKAADLGVRTTAEIHSPSRLLAREGAQMGAGVSQGIERSATDVQAAADKSFVPQLRGGSGGSQGGSRGLGQITLNFNFNGMSGNPEDLRATLDAWQRDSLEEIAIQLGAQTR